MQTKADPRQALRVLRANWRNRTEFERVVAELYNAHDAEMSDGGDVRVSHRVFGDLWLPDDELDRLVVSLLAYREPRHDS